MEAYIRIASSVAAIGVASALLWASAAFISPSLLQNNHIMLSAISWACLPAPIYLVYLATKMKRYWMAVIIGVSFTILYLDPLLSPRVWFNVALTVPITICAVFFIFRFLMLSFRAGQR